MDYIISYYNDDVENQILELPNGLLARYFVLTERMIIFGANLGEPQTKSMDDGLFELRLKSKEGIARVLYCTLVNKRIVMLHSFVKKTQKIPSKELKIARKRMKEVKNANT